MRSPPPGPEGAKGGRCAGAQAHVPWEQPLTEKVVQDEPVEYVLLQAADHDVLREELGINPVHQHLKTPRGWLARDHSSPGPPPGSALTRKALLPPASSYTIRQGQVKCHLLREALPALSV